MLKVDGGVSKGNLDAKLAMNGQEVFKNGIEKMSSSVINLIHTLGIPLSDLDWVIPHQANSRMFPLIADKLQLDLNKIASVVKEYANTSAATIPIALNDYIKSDKIKAGHLIALTAVGSGLTWGSAIVRI
jgi:3-oxoacyl-[acyl-carrier-protein] synthase-3